ncbi:hypothetical protein GCM10010420_39980 [Streptomyces glaucosporus]|uniref:DUF7919 domain-containing protein n=1 Tax=Streptomyces glaucosporus TaxID=284044 RepID=A0ABN3INB4_9ACTN
MTEYVDLSEYSYGNYPISMLNIGWLGLELGIPAEEGGVSAEVLDALKVELKKPRSVSPGVHECEFCSSGEPMQGNGELHIYSADGKVYSAPTMIVHYIEDHGYAPPVQFVEAVNRSTPLLWDSRAEALRKILVDENDDFGWKVDALLDVTFWDDPRVDESVEQALADGELLLVAEYEVGMALAALWARRGAIDSHIYRNFSSEIKNHIDDEYGRMLERFPR